MWTCTDPWRIWNPFCNVSSPCCCYPCFQDLLWFFHVFFFFFFFDDYTRLSMQNNGTRTFPSLCSRSKSLFFIERHRTNKRNFTTWWACKSSMKRRAWRVCVGWMIERTLCWILFLRASQDTRARWALLLSRKKRKLLERLEITRYKYGFHRMNIFFEKVQCAPRPPTFLQFVTQCWFLLHPGKE